MNILSNIKNVSRKTIIVSMIAIIGVASLATSNDASAANISLGGPKDCDSNAVVYCGANNVSQLQSKYNNGVSGQTRQKASTTFIILRH